MTKEDLFKMMNENPVMNLATVDADGQPHVREILMFSAGDDGIIFHTGAFKEMYKQLMANPKAEVCFMAGGTQIRVAGCFEPVEDDSLFEKIYSHPSRKFMQAWGDKEKVRQFVKIFVMKNGKAHTWTLADNFKPKEFIEL